MGNTATVTVHSLMMHAGPEECDDTEERAAQRVRMVRGYRTRVTLVLMVVCPALFLGGMWVSGVAPDQLIRIPDRFNPKGDVCLRQVWQRIVGKDDMIQVCSEWIQLSDPSGETHRLQPPVQVVETADGRLYFDYGSRADWRLAAFVGFVGAILGFGWYVRRYLVTRYQRQLERVAAEEALLTHPSS